MPTGPGWLGKRPAASVAPVRRPVKDCLCRRLRLASGPLLV
jgi:hypothetical protein